MTVFCEAEFVDYAIRACLPYVDDLVIVEGSYKESQKLGASVRSNDGTIEIIEKYRNNSKVHIIYANEESDRDQRNVGWKKIKEINPDGFMMICDGDEVYQKQTFDLIYSTMNMMRRTNKKMAYFNSLTFINDFSHYTNQFFPRLFDLKNSVGFVNDNQMQWHDKIYDHSILYSQKSSLIKYHHYSFCKSKRLNRTKLKKDWWESRFGDNYMNTGKKFEYDWYEDSDGNWSSPNHKIFLYKGKHPKIMEKYPLFNV